MSDINEALAEIARMRTEIAEMHAELSRADDFSNGLLRVFLDVLPPLLKAHPEIAQVLSPQWQKAAKEFAHPSGSSDSPEALEPRKMLFGILRQLGAL